MRFSPCDMLGENGTLTGTPCIIPPAFKSCGGWVGGTGCPRQLAIFSEHVTGTKPHQMLLINDSFSSQTWTIFLPNRNFYVKSIWCPTRPLKVRSQNQGYAQYLIKIKFPCLGRKRVIDQQHLIRFCPCDMLGENGKLTGHPVDIKKEWICTNSNFHLN